MKSKKEVKKQIKKLYKKLSKKIHYRDHDVSGSYNEYTIEINKTLGRIKVLEWVLNNG